MKTYRCMTRYDSISSIPELKAERARLHTLIEIKKEDIAADIDGYRECMSLSTLASTVMDRLYVRSPFMRRVMNGYHCITSIIDRFRNRGCNEGYDCECGCECDCDCDGNCQCDCECDCGCHGE